MEDTYYFLQISKNKDLRDTFVNHICRLACRTAGNAAKVLSGGFDSIPARVAVQSAYFETKGCDLWVAYLLMKGSLFWTVPSSFAVEVGVLFIENKSFGFVAR